MFGASEHRFRLGQPLDDGELASFERRHGIELPADYRAFVAEVGHGGPGRYGGAGPFYGLLPLHRWSEALVEAEVPGVLSMPFPVVPGRDYGEGWLRAVGLADDGEEWFPGAIALSHIGCGYFAVLVVTGPARGRVAYTRWSYGAPEFPPDPDFLHWYERWVDAVLAGARSWS